MGFEWTREGKCVLCGSTKSKGYIATKKSKEKQVCIECLRELDERRDTFVNGISKLISAAEKGAVAFKEELDRQTR